MALCVVASVVLSDGQHPLRLPTRARLNTRRVRACTFYLVFKEPAHPEVTFPSSNRVSAVIRRTHPEYRTTETLSTPFFRCLARRHRHRARRSGPQHSAPHVAGLTASPLGLGPLGLAGLGCRPPGALEDPQQVRPPSPVIQATMSRCVVIAGAPGKTFELSEMCAGCQPLFCTTRCTPARRRWRGQTSASALPSLSHPA